ncbi:MAG: hypothetical protein JNM36_01705 [Chitinophagales bacterium]|jgi:hypothetical protein|nr:hypothetical protein [Chitinophagales bacterium]HNI44863.1 hypothetical protein [Chitinophagales bacterium]HNL07320.1 hypothetical protein [Chitinophagales bacterium]
MFKFQVFRKKNATKGVRAPQLVVIPENRNTIARFTSALALIPEARFSTYQPEVTPQPDLSPDNSEPVRFWYADPEMVSLKNDSAHKNSCANV